MTYDMHSTIVEATSLSVVTEIAANPPLNPGAPAGLPPLPLTLYIARVPGSRDVFLTPIKPREKVVTAEDISSSLYYIHLNCLQDWEEPAATRPSSADTDAAALSAVPEEGVRRKPLVPSRSPRRPTAPPSPPYPMYNGPPQILETPPSPPIHGRIIRKPTTYTRNAPAPGGPRGPNLGRRPLPTPPSSEPSYEESLHAHNQDLLRRADNSDENNPYHRVYEPASPPTTPPNPVTLPEPGSLTLIRRDPASSNQWNVALIHDPPVQEASSPSPSSPTTALNLRAAKKAHRGGAPMYLDISNPSYAQFLPRGRRPRPVSSVSIDTLSSGTSDPPPEGVFRRRLFMPASQSRTHDPSRDSQFGSAAEWAAQESRDSADPRRPDRRAKGYAFVSPWQGRCEFSTGVAGKTLKCRHFLPGGGGGESGGSVGGGVGVEVSELRFNLPSSSSKASKTTPLAEKRSSYLHKRLHSSSEDGSLDFVFDDEGNIDLTLGRERAGGGFGGKNAKLGKLIIQPEGMGMLDLLVAANLGLWWRAWGK